MIYICSIIIYKTLHFTLGEIKSLELEWSRGGKLKYVNKGIFTSIYFFPQLVSSDLLTGDCRCNALKASLQG